MAAEPINIFSHRIDPAGVVSVVRKLAPGAVVEGPDENWQRIVIQFKKSFFGRALVLELRHNRDYYAGPEWPRQRLGMQGYFSQFPDNGRRDDVLRTIATFQFSLATSFTPDLSLDSSDQRNEILKAVARHLDGCFFTPSSLRDSSGRVMICTDGQLDPDAQWPTIPESTVAAGGDSELEEEAPESEPPDEERVFRRFLALIAAATRGLLEHDLAGDPAAAQLHHARLLEWIARTEIGEELEPNEWEVIQRVPGRLEPQEAVNSTWRWEGVAVLAWALGLHGLPMHDTLVTPAEIWKLVNYPEAETIGTTRSVAKLRSTDELAWMQARLLGIHWRLRDFSIRPQAMDFVQFSQESWFGGFDLTGIPVVDNDLAIGRTTISQADEDSMSIAQSAATERHQAINWLCWGGKYSDVDTST